MRIFISIFFLLNSILFANAQGAWDMKYVPINLLNDNWIGKEIRLDFKFSESDTLRETINIYELLSKKDTIILEIEGHRIFTYDNNYFDTKDLQFYFNHHNGYVHRIKVRSRKYVETNTSFFEIKRKAAISRC